MNSDDEEPKIYKKSMMKTQEPIKTDKHIYKYITLEKAQQEIEGCTSFEIKKNEHDKYFVLFYDSEDTMIEERLAREKTTKTGEKSYVCYDQAFDPNTLPENDFTRSFSPNLKKVLKSYQAASYIMNKSSHTLTSKNIEKYRVEYLSEDGEVIKISFALKCKNNSYVTPWKYFYRLPSSN